MQLILVWNMRAICSVQLHTVFVVIVWSVFGQSVTNDIDQLKKDIAEAKQQLQLLNDELGNFFFLLCNNDIMTENNAV